MSYGSGNLVTAADFNAIAASVNAVYSDANAGSTLESSANFGYGQTPPVSSVALGNTITAAQWTALFSAISSSATHQGTAITTPAGVLVGALIDARSPFNVLLSDVANLATNRLTVSAGQTTITSGGAFGSSTRTTSWSASIQHVFDVVFTNWDKARHFFNSGGQIRVASSRTGGTASSQNTSITNMLSSMGTIVFDHTTTTKTGGSGTANAIGFYDLTSSYQTIFSIAGSGVYTGDSYTLAAQVVGTVGLSGTIRFRATYTQATDGVSDALPDGTLISTVDTRRATGVLSITAPTYSLNTALTSSGAPNVPGQPTIGVPSSLTNTSIVFPVTVGSGTLPTSYDVYYQRSGASSWTLYSNVLYSASPQNVTVSGLTANTAYSFYVVAKNGSGSSTQSGSLHRITTGATTIYTLNAVELVPYSYPSNVWPDDGYSLNSAMMGGNDVPKGALTLISGTTKHVELIAQVGSDSCSLRIRTTGMTQTNQFNRVTVKVYNTTGVNNQRTVTAAEASTWTLGDDLAGDFAVWTWDNQATALEIYENATFDVWFS